MLLKRVLVPIVAACVAIALLFASVPPVHQAQAQYSDQGTWGGASGGTANAQTITIPNYMGHKAGVVLRFIPGSGLTNTGPTTININGLGAVAIQRPSSIGLVALSGQELWAGEPTSIMYNGSIYVLVSNVDMTPIGKTVEFRGASAPRGTLIEDGSCVSQTTYAALFSVIGSSYGSCSAGLFALPDSRGSLFAANDNQGANGAANRITSAGAGCAATSVGVRCGQQSNTLITGNLPPYTPSGSITNGTITITQNAAANTGGSSTGGGGFGINSPAAATITASQATSTFTGSAQGGSSVPFTNLPPILTGIRAIKY